MSPDVLADRTRRIDEAAARAGRSPSDIRRIANLGLGESGLDAPRMVDAIVDLADTHGFSTFILATDDPGHIETYATLVAPRVREKFGDTP